MCQVLLGSEYIVVSSEGEVHDTVRGSPRMFTREKAERQKQMSIIS